ncbi:MAG: hypothetical protein LBS33_05495 [Streptococcaceae bacterium]|jgi:hypothetical protein|nr:hypothetical protein [Streptococcaceae bacterium]
MTIQQEELIISIISEAVSRSISLAETLTETRKADNAQSVITLNEIHSLFLAAKTGYYLRNDMPSMIYIDLFNIFEKLYSELRHALAYDHGKLNHTEEFDELLSDLTHYYEALNAEFINRKTESKQKGLSIHDKG